MTNEEFEKLLMIAKLSKKTFSDLVGLNYHSVGNWKQSNKIPIWVKSWLNLYIENKFSRELKELIKKSGLCQ
ncbi:XRE family transcriptional regulator [Sulfurospirillum sp. 1612]|uniref:XRE family transcriptional regulator n=1 Tax=Sulfurospirillum sp. 1612 TaxID=3094835 RepID=UPI002F94D7DF